MTDDELASLRESAAAVRAQAAELSDLARRLEALGHAAEAADLRREAQVREALAGRLDAAVDLICSGDGSHATSTSVTTLQRASKQQKKRPLTRSEINPEGEERRRKAHLLALRQRDDVHPFLAWLGARSIAEWCTGKADPTGSPIKPGRVISYVRRVQRVGAPVWFRELVDRDSRGAVPPSVWDLPAK